MHVHNQSQRPKNQEISSFRIVLKKICKIYKSLGQWAAHGRPRAGWAFELNPIMGMGGLGIPTAGIGRAGHFDFCFSWAWAGWAFQSSMGTQLWGKL